MGGSGTVATACIRRLPQSAFSASTDSSIASRGRHELLGRFVSRQCRELDDVVAGARLAQRQAGNSAESVGLAGSGVSGLPRWSSNRAEMTGVRLSSAGPADAPGARRTPRIAIVSVLPELVAGWTGSPTSLPRARPIVGSASSGAAAGSAARGMMTRRRPSVGSSASGSQRVREFHHRLLHFGRHRRQRGGRRDGVLALLGTPL